MELIVEDNEQKIDIADDFHSQPAQIIIRNQRNEIRIEAGCTCLAGCTIQLNGHSSIFIGRESNLAKLNAFVGDKGKLSIGAAVGFTYATLIQIPERAIVSIGSGCLFANDTQLFASDMHSIVDTKTSRRINPAKDIVLAERVWVGERAVILKGVHIGTGSIIGLGSIVSTDIPSNCLAAGVPARIIREGVAWHHALLSEDLSTHTKPL